MSDHQCLLCDKPLCDGRRTSVVMEKGLRTLNDASKKRNDGKTAILIRKTSLEVHEDCRKTYSNERLIAACRKRSENIIQLRSSLTFNFCSHCFICGTEVPEDYEVRQKRVKMNKRNPVYLVKHNKVKDTVLNIARNYDDEYTRTIVHRLEPVMDLISVKGQYHMACLKDLYSRTSASPEGSKKRERAGRPSEETENYMEGVYSFLERNSEECQFKAEELMQQVSGDHTPHWKTIKRHLLQKYGEDIYITDKKPPIVMFKNTGTKIITEAWYNKRESSEKEERRRIVKAAAQIVVEDIRAKVYNTTDYPPPNEFLEGADDLIPESLKTFVDTVVLTKKRGNLEKWKKKSVAIAHCLITAVRPVSFVSPIQLGLAAFLYRKFASRALIDCVSALGFCSSYQEVTRCEISAIMSPPLAVDGNHMSQTVYDNADFNIQTLDGHNTFHVMGGIVCVTPKSVVVSGQTFARLASLPSAQEVAKVGAISLKTYEPLNEEGLSAVHIKDLSKEFCAARRINPTAPDLLWLYSKYRNVPRTGGWNGFMEDITKSMPYQTTFVCCEPFILNPPSDYDTIYTALIRAVEKTKSLCQGTTIVTFDQLLYLKAREVIASCKADPALQNVVVRLGGFHLLMSFMGTIEYVMEGSGLANMLERIYAVNSIEKIMSGHAYARAVRAHFLAHRALAHLILGRVPISQEVHKKIEDLLLDKDRTEICSERASNILNELTECFANQVEQLARHGPTAQLWLQYFEQVTLIKHFIEAERKGDWDLHLLTIYRMLPYFHASGHFHYAKCAQLYLQDMVELKDIMPTTEYEEFTTGGSFTVRRSDKLWCGTFTDQIIEQHLMRSMKTSGGLSRARGFSDAITVRWTQGLTASQLITEAVERFCGVNLSTNDQHVDTRSSRVKRDSEDSSKLLVWFEKHPPFPESTKIMSISTGIVGDERINCYCCREVGGRGISSILGKTFKSVKFSKSDRVNPLSFMNNKIKVNKKEVTVNPTTLFQRMLIAKESDQQLKEFLHYELSPYPTSMFDESGMRKGTKSALYKSFKPVLEYEFPQNTVYVLDGGFLLHRVVWGKNKTYEELCDSYIDYVRRHYKSTATVVFDGYDEAQKSTKVAERMRRATKKFAVEVSFSANMSPTAAQEHFLSNDRNKSHFINLLRGKMEKCGMTSYKAVDDADRLIVTTAISLAGEREMVVVVGEDIDLLVLLVGLQAPSNVYFSKPGRGTVQNKLYHPSTTIDVHLVEHILFVHAVTGCDTTSALFGQGKIKALKTLTKHPAVRDSLKVFSNPKADLEDLVKAGERFLSVLYTSKEQSTSLNEARYRMFKTSACKTASNIASLPPTAAAARQHLLRVYLQVQLWLGEDTFSKTPEELGWRSTVNGLQPVANTDLPAPDNLLRLVSCSCRKSYVKNCGCKKANLFCTKICAHCEGNCSNHVPYDLEEDNDLDECNVENVTSITTTKDNNISHGDMNEGTLEQPQCAPHFSLESNPWEGQPPAKRRCGCD